MKVVSHSSCRTSAISKYFCPLVLYCLSDVILSGKYSLQIKKKYWMLTILQEARDKQFLLARVNEILTQADGL